MGRYRVVEGQPTVKDLMRIRAAMGWSNPPEECVEVSLKNTLFSGCIYDMEELVGTARVVGDGAMFFYVQDVIVMPRLQRTGLGAKLMDSVMSYLAETAQKGAMVSLLSAKGKEGFYAKYGFIERPTNALGAGMCMFVGLNTPFSNDGAASSENAIAK